MIPSWDRQARSRAGVTLVEVLVAIGVIGLMCSFIIPAVERAHESAARMSCLNNLKQIGHALHGYHDVFGSFPPARARLITYPNNDPPTMLSWMALVLPHMGEESLWEVSVRACGEDPQPAHYPPHVGYTTVLRGYVCPDDARLLSPMGNASYTPAAFTSYVGIAGVLGTIGPNPIPPLPGPLGHSPGFRLNDIADGTSQTLLVGERPPPSSLQAGRWYPANAYRCALCDPSEYIVFPSLPNTFDSECSGITFPNLGPGRVDNACDRYHLWSWHSGGANFLFCDGSARFLPYSADSIIPALSTCAGGENVSLPD
jgi:prepilin-type processing-associated H-X9-DG protein